MVYFSVMNHEANVTVAEMQQILQHKLLARQ